MIALIVSDSHGAAAPLLKAVELIGPDVLIHLGDGCRDIFPVRDRFPHIQIFQVRGNCDFTAADIPAESTICLEGHRIFLCHGNRLGVKSSLREAREEAEGQDAELFLFGHTHQPYIENRGSVMLVNPGSIGIPRGTGSFAFAVARLERGKVIDVSLKRLDIR